MASVFGASAIALLPTVLARTMTAYTGQKAMAPENNVKLSDDVLQLLKRRAQEDGVSLDEAASRAVQIGLEEVRWRSLLTRGRRYGQQSGYSEDDVAALVESFRNENRGR